MIGTCARQVSGMLAAAAGIVVALATGGQALAADPDACASLVGQVVPAEQIALPTRGAKVVAAAEVMSFDQTAIIYCRVSGIISPIDAAAPDIHFDLALPKNWNGKALMLGGGGVDGFVPGVGGPIMPQPGITMRTPVMRGYAVFGSDSGHQQSAAKDLDASFMANDEALANFGGDALKKTHDMALALIQRRYGRTPSRTYFAGTSNGGREAFQVMQKWPADFDGVIAAFPAFNLMANSLQIGNTGRLLAAPGAWMSAEERGQLLAKVVSACDKLDGLRDGLISNVAACHVDLTADSCTGQAAQGGGPCLTPPQKAWLRAYGSQAAIPGLGPNGHYPGFPITSGVFLKSGEFGFKAPNGDQDLPAFAQFYADIVRYGITRDPTFDWRSFDPEHPGKYADQIGALSKIVDATNPDLAPFAARGGKLIVWHGLADQVVSHHSLEAYHAAVEQRLGHDKLESFARFYMVPGLGHGVGLFVPYWDPLTALEHWVEDGAAPVNPVAMDGTPDGKGRRRPLCEMGTWPVYVSGDPQAAESFKCGVGAGH